MLPHWERSGGGMSLQMRFYPLGMQCHIGVGGAQKYISHPPCIFPESRCYFAMQVLQEELRLRGTHSRQAIQGILLFIMSRVADALQKIQSPDWRPVGPEITEKNTATDAVEAACAYIEANFFQKITLAEIAEHALVSPTHLSHIFRAEKQMTLTGYITRFRLEYATSLLQHTRMSLGQIAKTVGYGNQSYFCQIFARHFECSPGQFRQITIEQKNAQNN
jgi:AraC-like DNA-binding protein